MGANAVCRRGKGGCGWAVRFLRAPALQGETSSSSHVRSIGGPRDCGGSGCCVLCPSCCRKPLWRPQLAAVEAAAAASCFHCGQLPGAQVVSTYIHTTCSYSGVMYVGAYSCAHVSSRLHDYVHKSCIHLQTCITCNTYIQMYWSHEQVRIHQCSQCVTRWKGGGRMSFTSPDPRSNFFSLRLLLA